MQQSQKLLFDEISRLPLDKIGKALSFIRYLEHEPENELLLSSDEETELHALFNSDDFIDSSEMLAKIKAGGRLPPLQ